MTPLITSFALILATWVAVVVDASAVSLRRQGRSSLAEAVALEATDGLKGGQRVRVTTRDNVVVVRLAASLDLPLHVPGVGPAPVVSGDAASEVLVTG